MVDLGENLAGRIIDGASKRGWGSRSALREHTLELSYDALGDRVRRVATGFRELGIEPGDCIALLMPDCIDAAVALLGAIYAGAVVLPMNELGAVNDIRDVLKAAGAKLTVVHETLRDTLEHVRPEVPSLTMTVVVGGKAGSGAASFKKLSSSAPQSVPVTVTGSAHALLLFSAGARPEGGADEAKRRGVPHLHATPVRAFESFGRGFLDLQPEDRVFSTVRMSTAYGLGVGLLFPLLAGAQAILVPQQAHSSTVFAAIERYAPTVFVATPSVYGQLARDAALGAVEEPLRSLRLCVSGAEDMPPKVISMARAVLGAEVTVGYGLTEAFQFVIAGRTQADGRPGGCGRALAGFELEILNDDGEPVGADEIGTLRIRGETIARSYWPNEPSPSDDGWFVTRDRFMRDEQGNYYHCGRVDQQFKVGGKWVAPAEVEQALLANEAVWECAVVGADDEDGLIKPLAFIVPNIGHEPNEELELELREYVKQELAPYKYPRWIEFVDELPKGPSGVILRYKLRELVRSSRRRRRAETRH